MDSIAEDIFRTIFNFLGACIRWSFGSFWRRILKKTRFTFREYLNGPGKAYDKYDEYDKSKNILIGALTLFIPAVIVIKYCF